MTHDITTPLPSSHERCAAIQAHLRRGGAVRTVTYTRCTIYTAKHADWFSANENGLYVRQGKGRVCLNFTIIQFSK